MDYYSFMISFLPILVQMGKEKGAFETLIATYLIIDVNLKWIIYS